MRTTEQFIWLIAYIDKDHIDKLQRELDKNNQYIGMEAQVPTVKILKKKLKGKEHFDDIPLLFNYGFFKVPLTYALNSDLLKKIKEDISCISHWVKDPAKVYISHSKSELTKNIILGSRDVPCATISEEEVIRLSIYARDESIHSSTEIDELKEGQIVNLVGYPFEGMQAKVISVDKKSKKVEVRMKLNLREEEDGELIEDQFSDNPMKVSFDNVFWSIYRGSYSEDYNKEKSMTDYQSKTTKDEN